jgi:myosin heavy subunit
MGLLFDFFFSFFLQANVSRDALAKALFAQLFDFLVTVSSAHL